MKPSRYFVFLSALLLVTLATPSLAMAQESRPPGESESLAVFTPFPSQVIGIGETVNLALKLRAEATSQIVDLEMTTVPEGWSVTFRGDGRPVSAAYVEAGEETSLQLRIEPPEDVSGGTYRFVAVARGDGVKAELPIELTVKERLPARLTFDVELPSQTGTPKTTFHYNATLKNEGDEEITVNLAADAPLGFDVKYQLTGKEVTSLPVGANEEKRITIEVDPLDDIPAGTYPIIALAQAGSANASLALTAEVTGDPALDVTTPDGRLSAEANAGKETPLKLVVRNTGTAPASEIKMSSSEPAGWSVEFEPQEIAEMAPGEFAEITVKVRPPEKAVAGDYEVTLRARGEGVTAKSAEFRITVLTSTLWGVAGIALIGVAVVLVALAVLRFGRR